jgi:U4/U6.U5 tri-snRNP-associated protein 2
METQQVIVTGDDEGVARPMFDIDRGVCAIAIESALYWYRLVFEPTEIKTTDSPFLFLALDLPPPPLFQDAVEKNIIPQVTLASVLAKYDGQTTKVKEHLVPL